MNKKMIALAVAAVMAPGFAAAEGASVSGFVDIIYTSDDNAEAFGADGEIDVRNTMGDVTVGLDVDFDLANSAGDAELEQAFFAWAAGPATVIGGVINNPIGLDAEDAPDMAMTSHSAVYGALDSQTVLSGNNIAGLAVAFAAGPATITAALLNDIQHADDDNGDDTHSMAVVVNMSPIEGLDLELGHVSQERDGITTGATSGNNWKLANGTDIIAGVGNVTNINAAYSMGQFSASLDYLMPSEVIDSVYDINFGYQVNDAIGLGLRISELAYAGTADVNGTSTDISALVYDESSTTLYASYSISDNLSAAVEYKSSETDMPGSNTDDSGTIELIATF